MMSDCTDMRKCICHGLFAFYSPHPSDQFNRRVLGVGLEPVPALIRREMECSLSKGDSAHRVNFFSATFIINFLCGEKQASTGFELTSFLFF